jgi:hypothetical protein
MLAVISLYVINRDIFVSEMRRVFMVVGTNI